MNKQNIAEWILVIGLGGFVIEFLIGMWKTIF